MWPKYPQTGGKILRMRARRRPNRHQFITGCVWTLMATYEASAILHRPWLPDHLHQFAP
jgi:hypothetical protein